MVVHDYMLLERMRSPEAGMELSREVDAFLDRVYREPEVCVYVEVEHPGPGIIIVCIGIPCHIFPQLS